MKTEPPYDCAANLYKEGLYDQAAAEFRKIIQQNPHDHTAWSNLGSSLRALKKFEAALACAEKAVSLSPHKAYAFTNYGNILTDLDREYDALSAHATAYRLKPDDFLIRRNYATSLREFCHYEHALIHYEAASRLRPDDNNIKWDMAITHLHMGNYKTGWEAFESRWSIGEIQERSYGAARWDGQPLQGKTILIHEEQGFGDTILCSRYIPMIKMQGARVILECKPALHKLFRTVNGLDILVAPGECKEHIDYYIPTMSLPGIFKTDLTSIPPTPDLFVPHEPPSFSKGLLNKVNDQFKVGIVWSGSVTFKNNRKRAVAVDRFLPLSKIPGVQLFSLQKGPCEKDLYDAGAEALIWDISGDLNDFTDTTAIIRNLDLVIMTDSSVAHLAGSIGCPVWNLLNYKPYWLYLHHREDCPWYPSMRLIRQTTPGDWDSVFERVAHDLEVASVMKKAGRWKYPLRKSVQA